MLALPPALVEHARRTPRQPAVRALFLHQRATLAVLRWQRLYSGQEPDAPHALTIAPDGSLVRARNDAGTIRVQRITSPGPGAPFDSWTTLTGARSGAGVALAAGASQLLIAYANSSRQLLVRTSTNNGATWSAETVVTTETANVGSIAAAYNATTQNPAIFYTRGTSSTLRAVRRSGASWGTPATWSNTSAVSSITGIAATYHAGDFHLLVSGTEATTGHRRVWGTLNGDGLFPPGLWSGLVPIAEADAASTVTFATPGLATLDSHLRATFALRESGPVARNTVMETATPGTSGALDAWTEPAPHEAGSAFGLALAAAPDGTLWASTPSGVWRAVLQPPLDLSERLLAATYRISPTGARLRLELDDAGAALPAAVYPGGSLALRPGYNVGGTEMFGLTPTFIVTRVTHRLANNGRRTVTIEGAGALDVLSDWRAPQAWQTPPATLNRFQLASRIAARAGFGMAADATTSTRWQETPGFALPLGESAASALARLAATTPDAYVSAETEGLVIRGLSPNDPPAYAYGPGAHPITSIELTDEAPAANWVRLQGADRYADAVDFASIYQHGPQLRPLRALEVATDAAALAAAAAALRRDQWARVRGQLVAPFFPGTQLFDVVTVHGEPYRVLAHGLDYRRGPSGARYDTILTLGAL